MLWEVIGDAEARLHAL